MKYNEEKIKIEYEIRLLLAEINERDEKIQAKREYISKLGMSKVE